MVKPLTSGQSSEGVFTMNMQWMRERSSSFLIAILFGIIIVVFALQFGPGSKGCNSDLAIAGKVNGQVVTSGEWSFYYNQLFSNYQRFDPGFNNQKAEEYNLKQKAFDQVVDSILLAQTGEEIGLAVGDKEAGRDIVSSGAFKDESGAFDRDLYRRMINYYYKMSVNRYEDKHKDDMAGDRIRSLLRNGPMVSENYAFDQWKLDNEKITLDFVKFNSADYKKRRRPDRRGNQSLR